MIHSQTRTTRAGDLPSLRDVLTRTGLFPPELLAGMVAPFLAGGSAEIWLTALAGDRPVGVCYARPAPLTEGTWDMLALAVHPDAGRSGHGAALVAELERRLRAGGQRLVIVDTSDGDAYAPARAFYLGRGYEMAARIRDYWAAGDDRITFRKALDLADAIP